MTDARAVLRTREIGRYLIFRGIGASGMARGGRSSTKRVSHRAFAIPTSCPPAAHCFLR